MHHYKKHSKSHRRKSRGRKSRGRKSRRHLRTRRGGEGHDIESGPGEKFIPIRTVPPTREEIIRRSIRPILPDEAEAEFRRGSPSVREARERDQMSKYDRPDKAEIDWDELEIFKRGGRRRKHKRSHRK